MIRIEKLESRLCFASAWQNSALPLDVDGSRDVSPADTEIIWRRLRQSDAAELPGSRTDTEMFYDPSGDGMVTPLDGLMIINALNRYVDPIVIDAQVDANDDLNGNGVVIGDRMRLLGKTLPDVRVDLFRNSLNESFGSVQSDTSGRFEVEVPLILGEQTVRLVATDPLGRIQSNSLSVRCADLVSDWNAVVLDAIRFDSTPPPQAAKNLAMIHTAMFDAANAIVPRYDSYLKGLVAPADALPEVAAAAAAYHVAKHLYPNPDQLIRWDATFAESWNSTIDRRDHVWADGRATEASITFGYQVGEAMLRLRDRDGSDSVSQYSPSGQPGRWRPTPPDFHDGLLPQWQSVVPFAIDSPDQFRPGPPPPLNSQAYADAVDEVMKIGGTESSIRTEEQTTIGVFWADVEGTFTPPGHWNQIAGNVLAQRASVSNNPDAGSRLESMVDSARVYSLLNLALADAGIASWDAKYVYDLWRPIDAIRNADSDGNDQTIADPTWTPEWINPPFPAYTSGHSSFSGAADAVLTAILGDGVAFDSQSDPVAFDTTVTRSFSSFNEAAEEAGVSRIYGGIHFNFDNTAGLDAGRAIGNFIVDHHLRAITAT